MLLILACTISSSGTPGTPEPGPQPQPLKLPEKGCSWLPPAPGCHTPAWVCISNWSHYGSASGTFGSNAVFGIDSADYARIARQDLEGSIEIPDPENPMLEAPPGTIFELSKGEETLGAGIYKGCMYHFSDQGGTERAAAETQCEKEAAAGAGSTVDACLLILVDACTGHIAVDCPDRHPRYATPEFTAWTVD